MKHSLMRWMRWWMSVLWVISYLKRQSTQKRKWCHCLFTILLTILNIMTSKMTNSSSDLHIILFKVFWYVNNHSLHWTVNCYNWITNYSKICCEQNQLIIQKTQKSKFEKESGIGIFSTKAGQDCQWVAIKMLNYYSHIHYHMASKDTDHFI